MNRGGIFWLGRVLLGPSIWALTFVLVYSLHGAGCALGWQATGSGRWTLHFTAMALAWSCGMAGGAWVLLSQPRGRTLRDQIPLAGATIGLASTFFTLLPLLFTSSC